MLQGSYMNLTIDNVSLKDKYQLTDRDLFSISLKVFVTNNYTHLLGALNGFLGIAPCPVQLEDYSFASQLLKFYKGNNMTVHNNKDQNITFDSIEWDVRSAYDNSGDSVTVNGHLVLNAPPKNEKEDYI